MRGARFVLTDGRPGTVNTGQGALRTTMREQKAILDHAPVGIVFTKPGLLKECNPRLAQMIGYSVEELADRDAGEMFASQRGLGYMAVNAMGLGDISTIMAVALLLTLIAVTCNSLMLLLDRKLQHR